MASTRGVMAPSLCCGHTTPRIPYVVGALASAYENLNMWEFAQRRITGKVKRTEPTPQFVNPEGNSRARKRAAFKYHVLLIRSCTFSIINCLKAECIF